VRFSENVLASAKGSSSPLGVQYIDLTSTGATDTAAVTISATSSNPALIAPSDIVITKSGLTGYDTMEIFSKAGAYGSATITLTANDGTKSTSIIIPVSVNEVAVQPVITLPAAETYKESAGWQTISIPVSIPPVNGVIPYVELSETRAAFRLAATTRSAWPSPPIVTAPAPSPCTPSPNRAWPAPRRIGKPSPSPASMRT
jgi:hypothetical protein